MKPYPVQPLPAADETPGSFIVDRYLPFRLTLLSNRLLRSVSRVYSQRFRLSAPEWRTIAVLGHDGATTANRIVERSTMDKVRVSRAVTRLLAANYITRRPDPLDRRRAILDLTDSGRALFQQIVPLVLAVESDILDSLNPDERNLLDRMLEKLEQRTASMAAIGIEEDEDDTVG